MAKKKIILLLVKLINKEESLYINAFNKKDLVFNKRDPANINEVAKMPDRSKNIKLSDIKHIISKSQHISSSQ